MTWREQALCSSVDPDVFFPEKGGGKGAREAKAICARCSVASECLAEALDIEASFGTGFYGVWGGHAPEERRKLLVKVLPRFLHGTRSAYVNGCRCEQCVIRQRRLNDSAEVGFVPSLRLPVGVA